MPLARSRRGAPTPPRRWRSILRPNRRQPAANLPLPQRSQHRRIGRAHLASGYFLFIGGSSSHIPQYALGFILVAFLTILIFM
jgi:hypothetical protein